MFIAVLNQSLVGCLLGFVVLFALPAQSAFLDAPVPSNAFITFNSLDWAWASPCSAAGCGSGVGLDLSFQSAFGWHVPSAAELALAPLATDFVFSGANVPLGGSDPVSGANVQFGPAPGDVAIAVPYFNTLYFHGDWQNAPGSSGSIELAWNGIGGEDLAAFAEFLVVRQVPEPSTMLLLGGGLLGLAAFRRKRK